MIQNKRNNSIYILIFIQKYFWASLCKIVAYLLGSGTEVTQTWVLLLVRLMCRRRKLTGTLTVLQRRKQCPEESRDGHPCERQNLWRHPKEMIAELCREGSVSIDILMSGVQTWTPNLIPPPVSHHPHGIHGASVLPTAQAINLGITWLFIFSDTSFSIHQQVASAVSSKYILMTLR